MSSQRKRKRSEKQDSTGRHQLYDWTKRTRKFSLKWKDDFPRDSLEENNRICQRSWQWQHVTCDVSVTLFPEFAAVCDLLAKFSTLYVLEILNVMRDYNEIYLSIFSVFHEIMLRAKWTSRNDDRISTFRGSLQGGPYCTKLVNQELILDFFVKNQCSSIISMEIWHRVHTSSKQFVTDENLHHVPQFVQFKM